MAIGIGGFYSALLQFSLCTAAPPFTRLHPPSAHPQAAMLRSTPFGIGSSHVSANDPTMGRPLTLLTQLNCRPTYYNSSARLPLPAPRLTIEIDPTPIEPTSCNCVAPHRHPLLLPPPAGMPLWLALCPNRSSKSLANASRRGGLQ